MGTIELEGCDFNARPEQWQKFDIEAKNIDCEERVGRELFSLTICNADSLHLNSNGGENTQRDSIDGNWSAGGLFYHGDHHRLQPLAREHHLERNDSRDAKDEGNAEDDQPDFGPTAQWHNGLRNGLLHSCTLDSSSHSFPFVCPVMAASRRSSLTCPS